MRSWSVLIIAFASTGKKGKMMQQALVLTILLLPVRGSESCKLYDYLRGKARVEPVNGLYYPYRCNNASTFCRIIPEFSCSPNSLHDLTTEINGDEYLPVMIDLKYDVNNSLLQDNQKHR
ncbi:hypothetical protein GBAR_LOCUS11617 [Geodia barretti]|uniref:Uncharacterized protein n=1 Tax=Geodia barretti TaxID=519541 RepID=A0AA35WG61_GEOBA|nr:hypothetical protein GBAR_LOCUS11617 [Geodia barretti]